MALRLKAKGKWRQVTSDALKGFSDLISIQELTDYEFVKDIDSGAKVSDPICLIIDTNTNQICSTRKVTPKCESEANSSEIISG